MAGMQPIVVGGKVFVGTMAGILHAMDDATGEDIWAFKTPGAILHTCAVAGNKVFFGNAEGKVYAVDVTDGKLAWSVQTGAAVWNSPVVHQGVVLIGSRDGKIYAIDAENGGLITQVSVLRSIFSRWRHLTPEIGRFCASYVGQTHKYLMDVCVDYHRPTWYLAWSVETMWRNECPFAFPTMSAEVFAAKALILHEPAEKLTSYLDIPWCKADLFYIQKLVLCIEAHGKLTWQSESISQ